MNMENNLTNETEAVLPSEAAHASLAPRDLVAHLFDEPAPADTRWTPEYLATLRRENLTKPVIFLGAGTCGLGAGEAKVAEVVRQWINAKGAEVDVVEVGCIGLCSAEPLMDVQMPGCTRVCFQNVAPEQVNEILDGVWKGDVLKDSVFGQFRDRNFKAYENVPFVEDHPFFKPQTRWVLANVGKINPVKIDEYIARGGYRAIAKVTRSMTPVEVCDTVEQSGLRGRGGGGFPTGTKWKFALKSASDQKYLICNADEGDPGAFMDRAGIEGDPHRMLEGMMVAAYAIGASKAYVYIRAEYPLAIARLRDAIKQAKEYGLLGYNILNSGFNLEIIIKMGAGAFVCGEE
ncbi:TPA: hypothetical protein DDW35_08520, partial [Candidatus Sumerlaeota bacterium]|nr:hypothetical protein [Candidatus Sumerlaeota bacterium]